MRIPGLRILSGGLTDLEPPAQQGTPPEAEEDETSISPAVWRRRTGNKLRLLDFSKPAPEEPRCSWRKDLDNDGGPDNAA